jgi:hypothetical protein
MSPDTPQPGDLVHDSDDPEPDDAIVVTLPDMTASEWEVGPRDCTLAEDNPDYPDDAAAVVVCFCDHLLEDGPPFDPTEQTELSMDTLNEAGVNHYSFPAPRLTVIESPASNLSSETTDEPDQPTGSEPAESPASETTADSDETEETEETEEPEESDPVAPPSPELLSLKDTLEESGLTVAIEKSTDTETNHTLTVEKLGQTYRVQPGPVVEGDGAFRSRLESMLQSG